MKILIWDMFELHNTGGPSGYVYNIHSYLTQNPNPNIFFLSKEISVQSSNNKPVINNKYDDPPKRNILKWSWHSLLQTINHTPYIKSFLTKTLDYTYRIYRIKWDNLKNRINVDEYDYIHFHFLIHIIQFRNTFPNYRGKTILTSHSPCPWTDELIDADKSLRFLRYFLYRKECKLYNCADYLMFPCPQAKEPYEHNKKIKATLDKLNDRTFYTPTSILTESNKTVHNLSRQDYNIPESAFIIAYFGRHNKIKGFDIFRDIVSKALEAHPNLYVLCAGSGEISSLRHPRWIELGFVSNVKDIMPLCDLYVLPNRETYFDLVVIEALRAGLVLNVSLTGGNKYFKTLPTSEINGIYYFDINKLEQALHNISSLYELKEKKPEEFKKLKMDNKSLFLNHFTLQKYIEVYTNNISSLH